MISLYFIIDFIVMSLFPINTYFIVLDIEKNSNFFVVVVCFILYLIYGNLLVSVFLYLFYFIVKYFNFNKKYRLLKNILFYMLFYLIGIYL